MKRNKAKSKNCHYESAEKNCEKMLSTVIQSSSYGDVINSWGVAGTQQNLYVEARPRGPNPYPFTYRLYPTPIPSTENCTSFLYLWSDFYKNFSLQKSLKYVDELAVGFLCSRYFESLFLYLNDSFSSPFLYFRS